VAEKNKSGFGKTNSLKTPKPRLKAVVGGQWTTDLSSKGDENAIINAGRSWCM
jgi:hypothetical protein